MAARITLRDVVENDDRIARYPDAEDAAGRALLAGASPPLLYLGTGMTAHVFKDSRGLAFKVGRLIGDGAPTIRRMLADEAAWLKSAGRGRATRDMAPRLLRWDAENAVIVREHVPGLLAFGRHPKTGEYMDEIARGKHDALEAAMIRKGWTAPENKPESWAFDEEDPSRARIFDAGMASMVGRRLVARALGLAKRGAPREDLNDAMRAIRNEATHWKSPTISMATGRRVLDALERAGGDPQIAGPMVGEVGRTGRKGNPRRRNTDVSYRMAHGAPGPDAAPLHDLTRGNVYPDDVYRTLRDYRHGSPLDPQAEAVVLRYRGQPDAPVTIYRSAPRGVNQINPGDWVSTVFDYARDHGKQDDPKQDWPVIAATVPAREIHTNGDSLFEWGYNGSIVLRAETVWPKPRRRLRRAPPPPRVNPAPFWVQDAWQHVGSAPRREWEPLRDAGGKIDDELGCGLMGCVIPTRDPRVVVKLTADRSEVDLVEALLQMPDPPWEGIVRYYGVRATGKTRIIPPSRPKKLPGQLFTPTPPSIDTAVLHRHYARPVFALWREAAIHVGLDKLPARPSNLGPAPSLVPPARGLARAVLEKEWRDDQARASASGWGNVKVPFEEWYAHRAGVAERAHRDHWIASGRRYFVEDERAALRAARDLLLQYYDYARQIAKGARDEVTINLARNAARRLAAGGPLRHVGSALVKLLGMGILLDDLHGGNLGIVLREDGERWVVTDPGKAVFL